MTGSPAGSSPPLVTMVGLYGKGISSIGPQVAERLGVPFLDHRILIGVAQRLAVPEASIESYDPDSEKAPRSRLRRLLDSLAQTLQIYYARDVLGDADLTILLTVLTTGSMFVVSPFIPTIVSAFGKKKAFVVAGLITAVGGLGVALAPPSKPALPIIAFAVYGAGIAACQSLMWALQADTVDYGEWKTGVRSEGINYSALSFSRKVGQGIGGAVAVWGIGVGGYVAGSAEQPQSARDAIRIVTGLGPAAFVGLGALLMLAYPLTERRYREIVGELTERNRERALADAENVSAQQ